jgi:hypothetical protein
MGAMMKFLLSIQLVLTTNFLRDGCFIRKEFPQKSKRINVLVIAAKLDFVVATFSTVRITGIIILLRQC